ncbi:MAG: glycerol-3-phosphate 1-O-acyltransferase PlsY [Burkholderiaceae bacterium]|nr:glycerol-3-phosphate 1-O-acyltransferase PlsY [Burkholderiaceae bacterium]
MIMMLAALVAYLVGSVSFAIVVSRLRGLADPRSYGSHNPGATNVLRSGDRLAAIFTLLGDALKGLVIVLLTQGFGPSIAPQADQTLLEAVVGFAVFLGHLFPLYFRFQGGKGVATAFGVLLGFDWVLGLAVGAVWLLAARLSRISSLGALSAALAAPLFTYWRHGGGLMLWSVIGIALLLIVRHRSNIQQLLAGKENGFKKP